MDNKEKKLEKNTVLMVLGNFSSKLLVFLLLPLYTSILTTSEYGVSDIIFTTTNLLYPIFTLLMSESILRFGLDAKTDKERAQIFSACLYVLVIATLVFIIISPVFTFYPIFHDYYIYFILYYISFIFYLFLSQYSKSIEKISVFTIAGIISTFTTILFNIIFLVIIKLGIIGYLISYILGCFISIVYMYFSLKVWKYFLKPTKVKKNNYKKILKYSIPMLPNSISWWISNSSDKYMIAYYRGISENGIYSVSYKIPTMLTTFSGIFINAWQISAVDEFGSSDNKKFYKKIYLKYSSLVIVVVSILILLSKVISSILFASDYYSAWFPACILLFGYIFNTLAAFLGTIYTSAKKTSHLFVSTLLGAVTNIVLNIFLIKNIGMIGAAIATSISYFSVWLYRFLDTKSILNLEINLKRDVISYLLLIVEILLMYLINNSVVLKITVIVLVIIIIFVNKSIVLDIGYLLNKKIFFRCKKSADNK